MRKFLTPIETIERKIYLIRGKKVMLDKDLAELYEVQTRDLNKAVKRNIERFPKEFMFQLNNEEVKNLMFQFGTSSWGGTRKMPYAFTEQGVAMLSSVLRSKRAIQVNIEIMKTFVKIREMIISNKELRRKIEDLDRKYDKQFKIVFDAIHQILIQEEKPKREIGFKDD